MGRDGGVRVRAYVNNDAAPDGERVEPTLVRAGRRATRPPGGTPLTVCASATVTGRRCAPTTASRRSA